MGIYVQYGAGLSNPEGWINFDSSPTLKLQKLPILNFLITSKVKFPENIIYGDIRKDLPGINPNSCDGVYCSHVLEHLSLNDFRLALKNTFKILKVGGVFRCVLPDLESYVNQYVQALNNNNANASIQFIRGIHMGLESRPRGLQGFFVSFFGNSKHLWMWDKLSLKRELETVGFKLVRSCSFNDSSDPMFNKVESEGRFKNAIAFEAIK